MHWIDADVLAEEVERESRVRTKDASESGSGACLGSDEGHCKTYFAFPLRAVTTQERSRLLVDEEARSLGQNGEATEIRTIDVASSPRDAVPKPYPVSEDHSHVG